MELRSSLGRDLLMKRAVAQIFKSLRERKHRVKIYESSVRLKNGILFFLVREALEQKLIVVYPISKRSLLSGFTADEDGGMEFEGEDFRYLVCPCNHRNASAIRETFPFARPKTIGLTPAIGTGDRIGLATPGHIRALEGLGVFPVLAQQSIREMDRTLRTPMEVLDDVSWAVFQEGYQRGFAADADHLKTLDDVEATFKAGFTMYTIDPSDYVDNGADSYDFEQLREKFAKLPWKELRCEGDDYFRIYLGERPVFALGGGLTLRFSEETLLRAAVKYSAAIAHTAKMYCRIKKLFGRKKFDVEVSVDETETPTSPLEHFFIASELKTLGVRITGLAPRFVGRFEKAVDYIGNLREFEESFRTHVLIAETYEPYKLSIHSGSDKFSIYPISGRLASGMIHLKTAGTSYLEALRIVARHDPALFREIVRYSLSRFQEDRKSYHVSTNLSVVPDPNEVCDENLENRFLDENNARQLLHITYGSILTSRKGNGEWLFRDRIRRILIENEEEHYETVARHVRRHIESVWAPYTKNRNSPVHG